MRKIKKTEIVLTPAPAKAPDAPAGLVDIKARPATQTPEPLLDSGASHDIVVPGVVLKAGPDAARGSNPAPFPYASTSATSSAEEMPADRRNP